MRKIKLYIVTTIQGYIAPPDGDIDWLVDTLKPSNEDYLMFNESVDTVIIGGNTYRSILYMDILWPYKGKTTYVVTHNRLIERENVHFITENVIETVKRLKQEKGKDIWLVGGGELTEMLNKNGLIDELIVIQIPVTLDKGIPLFSEKFEESGWVLNERVSYGINSEKKVYQHTQ